jgi:hypothetical protein
LALIENPCQLMTARLVPCVTVSVLPALLIEALPATTDPFKGLAIAGDVPKSKSATCATTKSQRTILLGEAGEIRADM